MWGLWDKLTTTVHLPLPDGPYVPGGVDIMTEYSASGTFVRVYYPSECKSKGDISSQSMDTHQSRWIPWLPDHRYFEGCAKLMGLWKILIWVSYAVIAGVNAKIPASWCSLFSPSKTEEVEANGSSDHASNSKKHPVVIISHGMAGNRFAHSALGLELASHGFVVAIVDHRDGSASGTFYYKSMEMRDRGEKTWLPYKNVKFGVSEHHEARKNQVELRSLELIKALDLLEKINSGEIDDSNNILHPNYSATEFRISEMKGRLDLTSPAVIGFSFGGPSALIAIKNDSRFRRGVAMDVWMFPIKEEIEETAQALLLPHGSDGPRCKLLFINSETFHNDVNLKAIRALLNVMKSDNNGSKEPSIVTIRGTTHEYLCDWSLLLGSWLDLFHMGKLKPVHGHQLLSKLVLQFLSEEYASKEDIGLSPELKSDSDDYIQCQLQHLVYDLLEQKIKK